MQHWFKLDIDWVVENFKTRYHDIYKSIFQEHVTVKYDKEQPIFSVIIGNEKYAGEVEFMLYVPNMKFQKNMQIVIDLASWLLNWSTLVNIVEKT